MSYIRTIEDEIHANELGGKAYALALLSRAGFRVPSWFVVIPSGHDSPDAENEVRAHLAHLQDGTEGLFAVRSSGVEEDSAAHSFAGQFESFLYVRTKDVWNKVREVWASGLSERVVAYRKERGFTGDPKPPAVLVQRMVDADAAGVAFSADPVSGRRRIAIVSAVWGIGTQLVGGDEDSDTWTVKDDVILNRKIATKRYAHRAGPEREVAVAVPDDIRSKPALSDEQVVEVAELARKCADYFGCPQDVEWAVRQGEVYLLQSRPVTTLVGKVDPDGELAVFDNSNIAESYGGITTPLTFSFARRAYAGVYEEFCKLMSVAPEVIEQNRQIFGQMLALVRGRVYYNLLNWYRLLAMLPGFAANRSFMEQMMGVREPLPPELTQKVFDKAGLPKGWRAKCGMMRTVARLLKNHWSLKRKIRSFYSRLDEALKLERPLDRLQYDELTAEFRRLEGLLLRKWDAPLINDFFAMIYFGLLGKLCVKWLGDEHQTLHSDLIREGGGIISAEPAQRIAQMGLMASVDPEVVTALREGQEREWMQAMDRLPGLKKAFEAYKEKFGDRCLEELKLESETLRDDATSLARAIGHAAKLGVRQAGSDNGRRRAEDMARKMLRGHLLRRAIFTFVLKQARDRVRDRENLRFERTRVFGRCRRIFLECGKILAAEQKLDSARDVFYLEVDEVLGVAEGTNSSLDLRGLVAVRAAEFERYRIQQSPADRFETRGALHLGNDFQGKHDSTGMAANAGGAELAGLGCCAGIVRGPVRVIRDPRGAELRPGEILVAERTDPGWIMLFPAAAGILVERGSLLSHSAIVARELGIPAIVSVPNLTQRLSDGQWVEFDGTTGLIRIIERDASSLESA